MIRIPALALAAGLAFGAAGAVAQKTAKDIPVETFFKRAEFSSMVLSPNGGRLAALAPVKGRNNLVVIDVAKRTRNVITTFEQYDVANFFWVNDDRLCLRVADGQEVTGRFTYRGFFCIDHDGKDIRDFNRMNGKVVSISPVYLPEDNSVEFIASINLRTQYSVDLYRFNSITGRTTHLTFDSPGEVSRWVLDRNQVPRIAISVPDFDRRPDPAKLLKSIVWYRDGEGAKWEKLWEYEMLAGEPMGEMSEPLAFDYDNRTLYVSSNRGGRDKRAIFKFDTKTRQFGDLVFGHKLIDVEGGLVFSASEKKLLGVRYDAETPSVYWFDPAMDRLQRQLDATFPKTTNAIGLPRNGGKMAVVFAHSDRDPGAYHLLDRAKPSLEPIAKTREWLDPNLMPERRFITYKARDGLEIPAWLTIPAGSNGKNLPLIVNVHGGPTVRGYSGIQWGRWPEAQFFASRGYAVLEPEPRNSTGFGSKHFQVGLKKWGQTMQDDINDGALHLVKEGIADKGRMCIHGGSYGGYAAAMGAVRDPDLWRCASPFLAVTDLTLLMTAAESDASAEFLRTDIRKMIGDIDTERAMLERNSPLRLADRARAPILLAMGSDDRRVPIVHGNRFNDALVAAGKKVEYVVYPAEGHGFNKDENVFDFYRRLEKFFAENLK
jgi:dipeptidyl aminopeptidase/acylaminoacyl peptidase